MRLLCEWAVDRDHIGKSPIVTTMFGCTTVGPFRSLRSLLGTWVRSRAKWLTRRAYRRRETSGCGRARHRDAGYDRATPRTRPGTAVTTGATLRSPDVLSSTASVGVSGVGPTGGRAVGDCACDTGGEVGDVGAPLEGAGGETHSDAPEHPASTTAATTAAIPVSRRVTRLARRGRVTFSPRHSGWCAGGARTAVRPPHDRRRRLRPAVPRARPG